MTPDEYHRWLEYIRYYEQPLLDFYYDHYWWLVTIIVGICMIGFLIPYGILIYRADKQYAEEKKRKEMAATQAKEKGKSSNENGSKSGGSKPRGNKGIKMATLKKITLPPHPLLAAEFKGHTGFISGLDFDVNTKYLASCSNDRTIRLWFMKNIKDKEHKYVRRNIELDHASHIKFSPDGTAVVALQEVQNRIAVFRISKQKSGLVLSDTEITFPKCSAEVLALDIASNGRYIMTYTEEQFTIWSLKGDVLVVVSTNQAPNTTARLSPCGKFIATAGFTSDVKIWEVVFTKGGDFSQVNRAMELSGHRASVLSVSFSSDDSKRAASVSKDGTWKFWDIDVRYQQQESPKLLTTVTLDSPGSLIALSPDAKVVAVATNTSISLYKASNGELCETLADVHKGIISALCWEPSSRYLASAGGDDRHVRLWHNTPGLKLLAIELQAKIDKTSAESFKERLEQQLEETKQQLKSAGAM